MNRSSYILYLFLCFFSVSASLSIAKAQVVYPGSIDPGSAVLAHGVNEATIGNRLISVSVVWEGSRVQRLVVTNKENGTALSFSPQEMLRLQTSEGKTVSVRDLRLTKAPGMETSDSRQIHLVLSDDDLRFSVDWKIVLNDHENFVRQFLNITAEQKIAELSALSFPTSSVPQVYGSVDGSPIIASGLFWAIENPLFQVKERAGQKEITVVPHNNKNTLDGWNLYEEVLSVGFFPEGQLRRAFLFYLDKIRAKPYRPLTFYDSWYDLSYDLDYLNEEDCIDRVKTWGDSLAKRGTHLNTFLWDSGWDDWNEMWNFNPHLPNGFKNINKEVEKYNATSGAWLSPWGGYSPFLEIRLKNVRDRYKIFQLDEKGLKKGLTLTDPNYYHYFKSVMLDLISNHGVTLFKIDGMGPGSHADGVGNYHDEMYALISLVKEIRNFSPDVYINLTVGTWPSPFWLCYADNIWKGGADFGYEGEGNTRQKWINYRDRGIYEITQGRATLCPVSSLMLHGVTIADKGPIAKYEMEDEDIKQEIWSFFGSGTSLRELYINPHKLNPATWDVLSDAIKWSREYESTLIDAHWIGGNPSRGEIYGYASWQPNKGTIMLRNPSAKKGTFTFTLNEVLELPAGHDTRYSLQNEVLKEQLGTLKGPEKKKITLNPFEVKVISLTADTF